MMIQCNNQLLRTLFIQINVQHIQAGNVEGVMREAEQRHREIMQATLDGIRAQFQHEMNSNQAALNQQLANAQSQYDLLRQQLTDAEMSNRSLNTQVLTLQGQNQALTIDVQSGSSSVADLHSRMQGLQDEHQQALDRLRENRTEGFKLELQREIKLAVDAEVQKSVDVTLAQAEVVIDELKRGHVTELQKVQSNHQGEIQKLQSDLDLCADSNDLLQQELDIANARIKRLEDSMNLPQSSERPATVEAPASIAKLADYYPVASGAKAPDGSPKQQSAPKETVAEQAARRLRAKANEGTSAAVTGAPALPLASELPKAPSTVSVAPTTPVRTNVFPTPAPSVIGDVPEKIGKDGFGDAGITGEHLLEIVKSLTKREDTDGKPKIKEAETIKLHDMPTPETYRSWKNHVREEVKACSDKPDEAWEWLNECSTKSSSGRSLKPSCRTLASSWHWTLSSLVH